MFETHEELKQQVVVWILVLEADRSLFLQMDGVDERDCAFIPVGLQIVSLRHPGRTARKKIWNQTLAIWFSVVHVSHSHTCCRSACRLRGDCFPARMPGYWIQEAWNPIDRSGYRCPGSSFLPHTGCTPEPTSPGTPRPRMRRLEDTERRGDEKRENGE